MIKNVQYFTLTDKVKYVAKISNLTNRAIANTTGLPINFVEDLKRNATDEAWLEDISFKYAEKIDRNFNALIKKDASRTRGVCNHLKKREKLRRKEIELLRKEVDEERYKAIYEEVHNKKYETMGEKKCRKRNGR